MQVILKNSNGKSIIYELNESDDIQTIKKNKIKILKQINYYLE